MNRVVAPQSRCQLGLARADITPPVGIYHRMWGAALHDQATGVHRPLLAHALWLEPLAGGEPRLVITLDHCIIEPADMQVIRERIAAAVGLPLEAILVTLSHTHGSGWLSRSRSHLPGGDQIGPYLEEVAETTAGLAVTARDARQSSTIVYGRSRCALAAHRDYWDDARQGYVCGFNPAGTADDTVLVAQLVADSGTLLGTLVNYACHPTTLAWDNTAISPDYVGAMREVIERDTGAPCLFLQGASGDLGPREGFVGDVAVADRNGRELGYAALAGLVALPQPGTEFVYSGPVLSGATLGTWKHVPSPAATREFHALWSVFHGTVPLAYRLDLPDREETAQQFQHWQDVEHHARAAQDEPRLREARARLEQLMRLQSRLASLPAGRSFPFPIAIMRMGTAIWVFTSGELYQSFQTTLRAAFPDQAIIVCTLTNNWHPGYVPPAALYGLGIYQETIATIGPGALEFLTDHVRREIQNLLAK